MRSENTLTRTLWNQSAFDAFFAALRQSDDDSARHQLSNLQHKGFTLAMIVEKARKTLGPRIAERVRELAVEEPGVLRIRSSTTRPVKLDPMSRSARLRRRIRHGTEGVSDVVGNLGDRLRTVLGRP